MSQNPECAKDMAVSLSNTQLKSKQWLVDVLCKYNSQHHPRILIVGGWYGSLLVPMLNFELKPSKIILTDIDPKAVNISSQLHKSSTNVECCILDGDAALQQFDVDIVINPSCEHMKTIGQSTTSNKGCLFVLQSCDNANDPGHINTAASTNDFVQKTKLTTVLFRGRMNLGHKNRFMVIGYK